MEKVFETLYKKNSAGSLQTWCVKVVKESESVSKIVVRFGLLGSDKIQETSTTISQGKNLGKTNETTSFTQAVLEASSKHTGQIASGYVTSKEVAVSGKSDLGGIDPMLAKPYDIRFLKNERMVILQAKLDGIRLIAVCSDRQISLFSRERKPIVSLPHIQKDLETLIPIIGSNWVLDGEIYSHAYNDNFNKIAAIVSKKKDIDESIAKKLSYHIYDIPSLSHHPCSKRLYFLAHVATKITVKSLSIVPYSEFHFNELSLSDVNTALHTSLEGYLDSGYEGMMVKLDKPYQFKRTSNLLKFKIFQDAEFRVVGIEEGKGKLEGHVGSFIFDVGDGRTFNAKMKGSIKLLKYFFENQKECIGKMMTVTYFNLTPSDGANKGGLPRFPVAKAFREDGL